MIIVFVLGYIFIALEHPLKVDKAATALILGSLMWILFLVGRNAILDRTSADGSLSNTEWATYLSENPDKSNDEGMSDFIISDQSLLHLGETAEILFFLLGAMTIVAIIDEHSGFNIITDKIKTRNKKKLLWLLSFITFFMSSVLDNLTTTIVMVTLLNKLISDKHQRWIYAGMIVLAANAGGAWSPIGDVTTIMMWIKGFITTTSIMSEIILPSLASIIIPLIFIGFTLKGEIDNSEANVSDSKPEVSKGLQKLALFWGIGSLVAVPILKTTLHLPPYMGMLIMLGIFWAVTDIIHRRKISQGVETQSQRLTVTKILTKVDTPTVLFFLGILTAVAALQSAGHLSLLSQVLSEKMGNVYGICTTIGVLSSVVDNVPLVAGAMGMYGMAPADAVGFAANFVHGGVFWNLIAYTAGTGGSILIIGSAAGVAAMGIEKIDFIWYLKHISWLALLGYLGGIGVFALQQMILG